jgi:DNA-binding response OmpR family regulator
MIRQGDRTDTDDAAATVLVVDDQPDLADLYRTFLSAEFDVLTATDGDAALDQLTDGVDVVLLDRRMPDMSGDEVLDRLRDRGFDVPVAMLTAVEPDSDILEMPFDDYEVKPVDRDELLGLVEQLLDRATYDERSREYFRLVSKQTALELAGKDDTPEYRELTARVEDARREADATLERVGVEAAFADLPGAGD